MTKTYVDANVGFEISRLLELSHAGRKGTIKRNAGPSEPVRLAVAVIQLYALRLNKVHNALLKCLPDDGFGGVRLLLILSVNKGNIKITLT